MPRRDSRHARGRITVRLGEEAQGSLSIGCIAREVGKVSDDDFCAQFDGQVWQLSWKWNGNPGNLSSQAPTYTIKPTARLGFNAKLKEWVDKRILVPWKQSKHGTVKNMVPLVAVEQLNGNEVKVCPVLDLAN